MAQLKDLIVNGPSRFIGDVYATTFTGDLNGNANTATSATTAAALTGKTLVTVSAVTTSNWPTYKDNHIPTMSFMTYWNGAYSGTSSNLTYCAQGTIIGSNNIGNQSVKYATTSGTCSGNAATATKATQDSDGNVIRDNYIRKDGNNGTAAGVSALINKLDIGSSTPTDADYYICQYAGGETTTTTYHRRPMSAMWNWIKAKTDTLYLTKSGTGASGTWGINITGNAATAGSATSANYANEIARKSMLDSQEKIDNFITANRLEYATFKTTDTNNVDFAGNDGMILSIPWTSTIYGAQMAFDDSTSGTVKVRGKSNTWGNWYTLLHSGNYTSYTVKKDGTGASGTWGINISGNATTSDRAKFLETFQQNSTTNTYGSQYPIWAQWSDSTNVRLKCTNYTVWTDKATYATTAGSAPASDVYSWAKQSTKPSYTGSEVKLTGYSKDSSYSAISASDTINQAIGKLEGAISGLEDLLASI